MSNNYLIFLHTNKLKKIRFPLVLVGPCFGSEKDYY